MARKNKVIITGRVVKAPQLFNGQTEVSVRLMVNLGSPVKKNHGESDSPIIECEGELAEWCHENIDANDIVHIEGEVRTNMRNVPFECEQCDKTYAVEFLHTWIEAEKLEIVTKNAPNGQEFHENHAILLGVVVRDPDFWPGNEKVNHKTKYQIVINRKDSDGGSDFPFIVSYNNLAISDANRLQKSSQLLVDTAIYTIDRYVEAECPHCGVRNKARFLRTNFVAKSTEYLNKCKFPENEYPEHRNSIMEKNSLI